MEDKIYLVLKKHRLHLKKREELIVDLLPLLKVFDGCCMSCVNWRYTGSGQGECKALGNYTEEGFFCKSYNKKE